MKVYYNLLSSSEQLIYDAILIGLLEFRSSVLIELYDANRIREIIKFILLDYPQIFYVNENKLSVMQGGNQCFVNINYTMSLS